MNKKEYWQALKFVLFSISAGAIELVSSVILYDLLHIDYWVSYVVALVLSVLWNFTFNRKYTFKSAKNIPYAMFLTFCFYLVFTPASTLWGHALESVIDGTLVTIISMLINFVTEFIYQRYVVFADSIDTAVDHEEEKIKKILKICKSKF